MKFKKLIWTFAAILLVIFLTSCNIGRAPEPTPDVNAIYTSAAATMVASLSGQLTQTAQAMPPTATFTPLASQTPLPTFAIATGSIPFGTPGTAVTPLVFGTPGTARATLPSGTGVYSYPVGCNDATFIGETKPYDGTVMVGGQVFEKGWSMQNSGTCNWNADYRLKNIGGAALGAPAEIALYPARARTQATIEIRFTAPFTEGVYESAWQAVDASGATFGDPIYIRVTVAAP